MKKTYDVLGKLAAVEGVRAAVLVSGDGMPLESVVNDPALDPEEVAALLRDGVASLRRMLSELDQGQLVQGVLEYSRGTILFTNLPLNMTLALVAARGANKAELWNATVKYFPEVMAAL